MDTRRGLDAAAAVLVCQADRLEHEFNEPADAARSYREAIRLFPQTPWAMVARERLAAMINTEGEIL